MVRSNKEATYGYASSTSSEQVLSTYDYKGRSSNQHLFKYSGGPLWGLLLTDDCGIRHLGLMARTYAVQDATNKTLK